MSKREKLMVSVNQTNQDSTKTVRCSFADSISLKRTETPKPKVSTPIVRCAFGDSIIGKDIQAQQKIVQINNMNSDNERIIEYNKKNVKENYVIIDKKNCTAKVYSPDGKVLKSYEVGLGMDIGDKRAGGYNGAWASNLRKYTTPGEFTLGGQTSDDNIKYGKNLFVIEGDNVAKDSKESQVTAIHQVPTTRLEERNKLFNNNSLADNRMSYGCINLLKEDIEDMQKYIKGNGSKLYILPEEHDNKLQLEQQPDGSYKFVQTKYNNA